MQFSHGRNWAMILSKALKMKFKIVIICYFLLSNFCAFSQNNFQVTFCLPDRIDLAKLLIQTDNGFGRRTESFEKIGNNQIRVSGHYYSEYAAVILQYPLKENWNIRSIFFVKSKPASVKFLPGNMDSSLFQQPVLKNAFDFKAEKEKLESYSAKEAAATKAFYDKHGGKIFDGQHDELHEEFMKLDQIIYKKTIEYIKLNRKSYFSFWYFRSNIQYSGMPIDSIVTIFDEIFPENLKNSAEGKAFKQFLRGKLETKRGFNAPPFSSEDINGNSVSLSNYRNKKLVLLNFWATWCGPCIKKIPALAGLQDKFGSNLEIISIAYPTTLTETKQVITRYKMNWINIYNDEKLINSYGGMGVVPRMILIDKTGNIIFDSLEAPNADIEALSQLLSESLNG